MTRGSTSRALQAGRHRDQARAPVRRLPWLLGTLVAFTLLSGWYSDSAVAAPAWNVASVSNTTAQPGTTFDYFLEVRNVGDVATNDGDVYTLTVTLPDGMIGVSGSGFDCPTAAGASAFTCTRDVSQSTLQSQGLRATITVDIDANASGIRTATFEVGGGGAPESAITVDPVLVSATPRVFGIDTFDAQVTADASGSPFTQAAGHPYGATTSFDFNTATDPNPLIGPLRPIEPTKDVVVDLPPGFVGDPTAATRCTLPDLANTVFTDPQPLCAPTSQVGTVMIRQSGQGVVGNLVGPVPFYNMVPPPGAPARFAFNAFGTVVVLDAELRSGGDYGLSVAARNISEGIALIGSTITLWGVPADASHDGERACPGTRNPWVGGPTCANGAPRSAFLRNPTSCTAPVVGLPTTMRAASWFEPGDFVQATSFSHLPRAYPYGPIEWGPQQGPDGCARVPFTPTLKASPVEASKAAAPAAMTFDLTLPQNDEPASIGQADLRKAVVTLPQGVRVAPGSADGLQACSSAQIALRSTGDPTCPVASKIGSLTIDTPLLDEQLKGGIYLAKPFDNPFNSLVAIYLVAKGPGLIIKLPGQASMDPDTGQITATFDDNPQLPFERLHLEFKGGPRAPLALPKRCGTYTTHAELTGWNGRRTSSDSSFTVTEDARGKPCPSTFTPGFEAGTDNPIAGKSSTFLLSLTRDDEDQELKSITVDLPEGLLGRIASVPLCDEGNARAGSCADSSKVGSVTVGAGAGSNPFYITNGRAYLTGPFKGAPFGLSIVVQAVAGPFDLGTVVVRSALFVDKHDASVRVVSDPLPTILDGIPLDVRDVRVAIDRDGFFLNPTSCAEKQIDGTITSTEGATANVSSRFQVSDCADLALKPKMVLKVGKQGRTGRNASTPFTATLTQTPGQTNLKSVKVTLPTTINARLNVVNRACTRAEFEAGNCNKARAGSAVAVTPLLKDPLRGGAFFVRNGHPLPDLFVALRGQVDFDLIGRITIPGSKRLATTFDMVPDVPISSFSLSLVAGRQGPVGTTTNLCSRRARKANAQIDFQGQNGKTRFVDQRLKIVGCQKARRHGRRR